MTYRWWTIIVWGYDDYEQVAEGIIPSRGIKLGPVTFAFWSDGTWGIYAFNGRWSYER